jgi:hypothetical protein
MDRIGLDPARNRRGRRSDATPPPGRGDRARRGTGLWRCARTARPDRRVPTGNGTAPAGPPRRRGRLIATVRRWGPSFPPRSCPARPAPRPAVGSSVSRAGSRNGCRFVLRFTSPRPHHVASQFPHATRLTCDTSYVLRSVTHFTRVDRAGWDRVLTETNSVGSALALAEYAIRCSTVYHTQSRPLTPARIQDSNLRHRTRGAALTSDQRTRTSLGASYTRVTLNLIG